MTKFHFGFAALFSLVTLFSCKTENSQSTNASPQDSVVLENTIPSTDSVGTTSTPISELNGTFTIDPQVSLVTWEGSSATKKHTGVVKLKNGTFTMENGKIASGSFELDMPTLMNTDLKPEDGKEKLEGHLKAPDFFDVAKYPTAKFVVKSSEVLTGSADATHKVTGDLTIKDKTNPITFDLNLNGSDNGNKINASSKALMVNRTKYGIVYNSGVINTVKEKLIDDNISLLINILAKK